MDKAALLAVGIDVAFGIRITRHVQPVSAPALAVARRRQQTLNHPRESFGRLVLEKCVHLIRCRRQADQIVSGPPNQRAFVRRQRGLQSVFFQLRENEIVYRRLRPARVFNFRNGRLLRRLKGPML